jgi:diguanylate cyclase (GGDEF)-like protein
MSNLNQVVKETLQNLTKKAILATPNEYSKEFCSVAKKIKFTTKECKIFEDIVLQLSKDETKIVTQDNLSTIQEITYLLLKRIPKDNIKQMSALIGESLQPSISINLNDDLHQFSVKIGDSPELIFENDIQTEIQKFIENRINLDKDVLKLKAKEIAKIMTYMTKHLSDAIDSNTDGSSNISDIAKDIESLDSSDHIILSTMQSKLVDAAKSIENAMEKTTTKLKDGQNQVQVLQAQIDKLEKELAQTKKESDTDHLTGLLTRRAYDRYIRKIEDNYQRHNVNYAVVFFDIDHFKNVNDNYGHDAGDVILATFAKVLLRSTRDSDIVGRYGGEEFVAILNFSKESELEEYITRVKSIVTEHKFKYKNLKIPITFSAGVTIRSNNKSYENTIKIADKLLYQAKNTGRNKIIFENGLEL